MESQEGLPPEADAQIRALSDRLDRLNREVEDRATKVAVPATLFHYTKPSGLKGIIESGRLRLSDIFGLNDPSEMRHGVQYALNALQQAAASGHKGARLFAWRFSELLGGKLEEISRQFVACFSPSGDDLGQWRAYADNGKGFALGFDGPSFEAAFGQMPHLSGSFAMIYDDQSLRQAVEQIAREALHVAEFPLGRRYDGPTLAAFLRALSVQTSNAILYTAMYFKHPAYDIEKEYRFEQVRAIDNVEGVITVGGRSYIEFDWRSHDPRLLTHVMLGPAADQKQARRCAEECLGSAGIDPRNVCIQPSAIPYRS
jgi:DUF2971 family protein